MKLKLVHLGCGNGELLQLAVKESMIENAIGIDKHLKTSAVKDVELVLGDCADVNVYDWTDADVVLVESACLDRIEESKLLEKLKEGSVVVSMGRRVGKRCFVVTDAGIVAEKKKMGFVQQKWSCGVLINPLEIRRGFWQEMEDIQGAKFVRLLKMAMHSMVDEKVLQLGKDAMEFAWEQLHLGAWKDVSSLWRLGYGYSTLLLGSIQFRRGQWEHALNTLDMGLLMCGSKLCPELLDAVDEVQRFLPKHDTQVSKKRKRTTAEKNAAIPSSINSRTGTIPRIQAPSLQVFKKQFMDLDVPVILTGVLEDWPAMGIHDSARSWSNIDYLRSVAGRRTVPVEIGKDYRSDSWGQSLMNFNAFLDQHIENKSSTIGYLAQHPLFDQIDELRNDIQIPDYCALSSNNTDSHCETIINAWFGPAGTVSPLHNDPYHNLLCQVVGSKFIQLYAVDQAPYLYVQDGMLSNTSMVEVENVDLEKYPLFPKAKCIQGTLHKGEALYMPPKYWHYIRSLETSFSVSLWWT